MNNTVEFAFWCQDKNLILSKKKKNFFGAKNGGREKHEVRDGVMFFVFVRGGCTHTPP